MNIRRLRPGAFVELACKHFVSEGVGISYFVDETLKEKFKPHVFFIWGVLPGERFIARLAKVKSKVAHGVLARREELPPEYSSAAYMHSDWALVNSSPDRVESACTNFLRCGGCKMRHITYERSLDFKTEWLAAQLARHKLSFETLEIDRAKDDELLHYRNHVQVHINKFGVYGFFEPLSYRTRAFPEHGCLIFDEKNLRDNFPRFPVEVRTARIRRNSDGTAVFSVVNGKDEAATRMRYNVAWPWGSSTQIDFSVTQFFQVNLRILPRWLTTMADYLQHGMSKSGVSSLPASAIRKTVDIAKFSVGECDALRVLELFSGFGFISRNLAQVMRLDILAADLIKREEVESVVMTDAEGKILSADFVQRYHRVDLFLPDRISADFLNSVRAYSPQAIIVNPPRAGLLEETWRRLRAEALADFVGPIVYSSCNASTMARDIAYLREEGWGLAKMQLFDFFPWTHHFETVALLIK